MTKDTTLNSVLFLRGNDILSYPLVSTREYGRWLKTVFDTYTCEQELYLRSKESGETVLQFHPGTKIGQWFDKRTFLSDKYCSVFLGYNCSAFTKLKDMGLVEGRDSIPSQVTDERHRRFVRLYTIYQIELYVRSNLDREFNIQNYLTVPKQLKLNPKDFKHTQFIKPSSNKRSLF